MEEFEIYDSHFEIPNVVFMSSTIDLRYTAEKRNDGELLHKRLAALVGYKLQGERN